PQNKSSISWLTKWPSSQMPYSGYILSSSVRQAMSNQRLRSRAMSPGGQLYPDRPNSNSFAVHRSPFTGRSSGFEVQGSGLLIGLFLPLTRSFNLTADPRM